MENAKIVRSRYQIGNRVFCFFAELIGYVSLVFFTLEWNELQWSEGPNSGTTFEGLGFYAALLLTIRFLSVLFFFHTTFDILELGSDGQNGLLTIICLDVFAFTLFVSSVAFAKGERQRRDAGGQILAIILRVIMLGWCYRENFRVSKIEMAAFADGN